MTEYPKIEYYNKGIYGQNIIGFDKLDGSNIRASFSRKKGGFYKFGTKNTLIDKNSEDFGKAIPLFLEKYNESLSKVFTDKYKKENFVVFCEYLGENSFAGIHDKNDKMDIVLFDVNEYTKGFIQPWEFVENFGHLDIPKIIYKGIFNEELIHDVKNNKFNLKEGIIVKGVNKTKKEGEYVWQVKIKTLEWLNIIKTKLGHKALIDELNNDDELLNIFNENR